jgi:hypothetical protein
MSAAPNFTFPDPESPSTAPYYAFRYGDLVNLTWTSTPPSEYKYLNLYCDGILSADVIPTISSPSFLATLYPALDQFRNKTCQFVLSYEPSNTDRNITSFSASDAKSGFFLAVSNPTRTDQTSWNIFTPTVLSGLSSTSFSSFSTITATASRGSESAISSVAGGTSQIMPKSLSAGAKVGIGIAAVLFAAILLGALFFLWRRRRSKPRKNSTNIDSDTRGLYLRSELYASGRHHILSENGSPIELSEASGSFEGRSQSFSRDISGPLNETTFLQPPPVISSPSEMMQLDSRLREQKSPASIKTSPRPKALPEPKALAHKEQKSRAE